MTDAPTTPQSREAEESVLGSVLINPDTFHDCASFLETKDFFIHRNGWIWEAFVRLHETNVPIDFTTVATELERLGRLSEVGGPAYLTSLVSRVDMFDSNHAEHYARIVEGFSIKRKMIAAANETAKLAYSSIEADEALNKAHETLQAITPSNRANKISLADRLLEAYFVAQDGGEIPGINTGISSLNTMLGGWRKQQLVYIAARPGMGKTGLLITSARAALKANKRVVFFSMEMGDESVAQRMIAQQYDLDVYLIGKGRLIDAEMSKFTDGIEWIRNLTDSGQLTIFENSHLTASQIHSHAKKLYARDLCDVVFVDYVQLMSGRGENRAQEVSDCSRGLKMIAQDLHIPVVAAAQLNRDIEKRGNPKPVLSDLKESGSLEQDGDIVVFIWNNSKDGEKVANAQIDPAFLTVAKHRNGKVGDLVDKGGSPLVQFVRKSTKFEDA